VGATDEALGVIGHSEVSIGPSGCFLLDFAGEDFFLGGMGLSGTGAGCVTGGGGDNAKTQAPALFR
jgi:hypothetical protein